MPASTMLRTAAPVITVAAAVLGAAWWAGQTTSSVHVETAAVTAGPIARSVIATGTLEPVSAVDVGGQTSGMITALGADANSRVHTGQELARLDAPSVDTELVQAQAAVTQAIAERGASAVALAEARAKLGRAQSLAARQIVGPADLEAAQAAYNEASATLQAGEAEVEQARAAREQIETDRPASVITSPIDGVVIERHVQIGDWLAASPEAPVPFRIAPDLARMHLRVSIDESDIGELTPLGAAVFTVDAFPGQVFHGVLSTVPMLRLAGDETSLAMTPAAARGESDRAASAAGGEVGYTALIDVDNSDRRLLPGMTATVTLPGPNRTAAVRIPNAALNFRPQSGLPVVDDKSHGEPEAAAATTPDGRVTRVWLFDGEAFRPVTVEIGVSDGQWSELVKGALQAGDQLVIGADIVRRRHI